jgi:cytochrome b-561
MSSATGIPQQSPRAAGQNGLERSETEPLLGRPGDVAQVQGHSFFKNLVLGTGLIAETAAILFFILIWVSVFTKPVILFSGHPLAQSLGILILIQSILTLQPTHTAEQKRAGQWIHATLNLLAFLSLAAGVIIIEYNKVANNQPHFHSVHGYLGVITSIILLLQYFVGFTMWATPSLYGGDEKAKAIWKYHRYSGYTILVLLLATVCSATQTTYNVGVLKVKLWATILLSVLILIGIVPRIQKQKLGFRPVDAQR